MIISFRGEYSFLSNFYPVRITIKNNTFPSSEHAYQSFKNDSLEWIKQCTEIEDPSKIKKLSQSITLNKNWDSIKLHVMDIVLRAKFSIPEMEAKLIDTGNQNIIEGNYWNDTFWGVCLKQNPNCGENHLGRLLMKIREELKLKQNLY
jgi:ribA/ribD-fused uncharacterized protein